jgi:hypothetical protein
VIIDGATGGETKIRHDVSFPLLTLPRGLRSCLVLQVPHSTRLKNYAELSNFSCAQVKIFMRSEKICFFKLPLADSRSYVSETNVAAKVTDSTINRKP